MRMIIGVLVIIVMREIEASLRDKGLIGLLPLRVIRMVILVLMGVFICFLIVFMRRICSLLIHLFQFDLWVFLIIFHICIFILWWPNSIDDVIILPLYVFVSHHFVLKFKENFSSHISIASSLMAASKPNNSKIVSQSVQPSLELVKSWVILLNCHRDMSQIVIMREVHFDFCLKIFLIFW